MVGLAVEIVSKVLKVVVVVVFYIIKETEQEN